MAAQRLDSRPQGIFFYPKIDPEKAYFAVRVDEFNSFLCCFLLRFEFDDRLYEWVSLPFGLSLDFHEDIASGCGPALQ